MLHKYSNYYHDLYRNNNFEHSLLGFTICVNARERGSETEDDFQSDVGRTGGLTVPDGRWAVGKPLTSLPPAITGESKLSLLCFLFHLFLFQSFNLVQS